MPLGNTGKIGDWSAGELVKYIRDLFQNSPPDFLPFLKAEEIQVYKKLVLRDDLEWLIDKSYKNIGGVGSPAFANSWANYGSGYVNAGYWKDPFGIVHLRGMISSGTVGNSAFTMAPGYRPAENHIFGTISNGAIGRVDVSTDGTVKPVSPSSNTWVSLSGITYKAL
jgi:hypothetical protein